MQQGLNQYLNSIPGYSVVGNNLMLLRGSESHFDPDEGDYGAVVQTSTWEDLGLIGLSSLRHSPWVVSWILPLWPRSPAAGVGPAGSIAWNP